MTRKDYVALAEALAEAQNHATDGTTLQAGIAVYITLLTYSARTTRDLTGTAL